MRTAILLTICATAGCYNYMPVTTLDPRPGTYLALTLTDVGSDSLTRSLGPNAFIVRGRSLGSDDRALLVSVASVELRQGPQTSWSGETVRIPMGFVASVETRQLAKSRSVLLAGASVVGIVAAAAGFSLAAHGSGNIYAPPGPPTAK